MNDSSPVQATVKLVEFDQGPGLRIDIIIPWVRLLGLAQQIRWWSRWDAVTPPSEFCDDIDPAVIGEPEGK